MLAITARYYLAIFVLLKLDGCRFIIGLVLYPFTFTTHPFRLIWLVKLAVTAAFGCSPSTISCCQGPRLTADTLLLTPSSPTVPDHWDSTQHINKIVPLKDSIVHANLPAAIMCRDYYKLGIVSIPDPERGNRGLGTRLNRKWIGIVPYGLVPVYRFCWITFSCNWLLCGAHWEISQASLSCIYP